MNVDDTRRTVYPFIPTNMKIVVMSDTHLNRVTEEFEALCHRYCRDADLVIHLGDLVSRAVLDYLEQYPLEAVSGNTDDYALRSRLPAKKTIRLGSFRVGLIHGWGTSHDLRNRLIDEFSNADAILFGHTHQPVRARENGLFWFNPGSVSAGRNGSPPSLGILTVDGCLDGEIIPLPRSA